MWIRKLMRRKNRVILGAIVLEVLLLAGCHNFVEKEIESQVFESEEIQSEELQSTNEESSEEDGIQELPTEDAEGKIDIATINKYGTFEEALKICIQEKVALKEETKIESISWVDEAQKCLRVAIQYKEQPQELWFNHLEDYFFFVKEDKIEVLYVDYGTDVEMERIVWAEPDFKAHLEDVNFDGQADLIIALGSNGAMYGDTYCAYLYTDRGYEYCPSFEQVAYNYRVDNEKKCIVATIYPDTAEGRIAVEKYYEFKKNEFREREIYTSSNANAGIRSVEVLDAEKYILKYGMTNIT